MVQSTLLFALAGLAGVMEASPLHGNAHRHAQVHRRDVAGKRGLAFPKEFQGTAGSTWTSAFQGQSQITWMYDWEAVIDGTPISGLNYVPLLHSNEDWCASGWVDNVAAARKKYDVTHILSFNEPDQSGGGGTDMSVSDAVKYHKQYIQPLASDGLKIGSPAVTNGDGSNMGINYLKQFMSGCSDCQIDFVVAHYYSTDDAQAFKDYLSKFHSTFNKPVWVTEFGVNAGQGDANAFLKQVLPWLDQQDWIQRYAYHMVAPDVDGKSYLINSDGSGLTAAGQTYATCASS